VRGANPKFEARSTKWFDRLTTLSRVEGQIRMAQTQMTQTNRFVLIIGTFDIRACFEFRVSEFEFQSLAFSPDFPTTARFEFRDGVKR
jgi:hypothetical protein